MMIPIGATAQETDTAAKITGVTLTVDGVTYTGAEGEGYAFINPNSDITVSITGVNLNNMTEENVISGYLLWIDGTADWVINADGTEASLVSPASDWTSEYWESCSNKNLVYTNESSDWTVPLVDTGIKPIYLDNAGTDLTTIYFNNTDAWETITATFYTDAAGEELGWHDKYYQLGTAELSLVGGESVIYATGNVPNNAAFVTFSNGTTTTGKIAIPMASTQNNCYNNGTWEHFHTPEAYSDNGDGTHTATCSVCGHKVTGEHITEKNENKPTCQHGNICDLCGAEYGEANPDDHSYNSDGFCEMCSTANPDETMFFIYDGDHKAFNVAEDIVGVNIEYTRGMHNTEWNSMYLPFEVPVTEELLDEYEVAYVNDMHSADTDDNGEIDEIEMEIVKIKTGTLHANHPYFIRAKSEAATELQLSYENTTLHATEETTLNCSSIYMDYAIVGTYKRIKGSEFAAMPADRYYAISVDGGWWQIPEDTSLYPFRVYLSMTARDDSPVKVAPEAMARMRIVTRGESEGTTGIENSELINQKSEIIYDLQGRRVAQPTKGIYIVNGKKVIVK